MAVIILRCLHCQGKSRNGVSLHLAILHLAEQFANVGAGSVGILGDELLVLVKTVVAAQAYLLYVALSSASFEHQVEFGSIDARLVVDGTPCVPIFAAAASAGGISVDEVGIVLDDACVVIGSTSIVAGLFA